MKSLLAAFFVLLSPMAFGASPIDVIIRVTDSTGGSLPGSHVVVRAPTAKEVSADNVTTGVLLLKLRPSDYDVFVDSPGFRSATKHIWVHTAPSQTVTVALSVGSCPPGNCYTVATEDSAKLVLFYPEVREMIADE
jgi:hypothetical protein